jgi:hypothetical protein
VIAIEAARLAPLVDFETLDDAIAARDTVAAQLEEQAEGAGDTAYPMLVDLRARVLRAVPGGTEFARVVTVTGPSRSRRCCSRTSSTARSTARRTSSRATPSGIPHSWPATSRS